MIVDRFRILVGGQPVRLYVNSATKQKCFVPDPKFCNEYPSDDAARKAADRYGVAEYVVEPFKRDIGTPTNLAEIGI